MSVTQKVTTHTNKNRCYSSTGIFTSNCTPFSSFKHYILLYLIYHWIGKFKQMLNFFNISGSEVEKHSVHSLYTYFKERYITLRPAQTTHFTNSLYPPIWSFRDRLEFVFQKKYIESYWLSSFCFDIYSYKLTHILLKKLSKI